MTKGKHRRHRYGAEQAAQLAPTQRYWGARIVAAQRELAQTTTPEEDALRQQGTADAFEVLHDLYAASGVLIRRERVGWAPGQAPWVVALNEPPLRARDATGWERFARHALHTNGALVVAQDGNAGQGSVVGLLPDGRWVLIGWEGPRDYTLHELSSRAIAVPLRVMLAGKDPSDIDRLWDIPLGDPAFDRGVQAIEDPWYDGEMFSWGPGAGYFNERLRAHATLFILIGALADVRWNFYRFPTFIYD